MDDIKPVILAGGGGERLWPLSQADFPKQFCLRAQGGLSLFQTTLQRVSDRTRFASPLVIISRAHQAVAARQMQEIGLTDAILILEPMARNTAAAIGLAANHVAHTTPDSLMLVLPSDHRVDAPEKFVHSVERAAAPARGGKIVTFAVTPTSPETGYGYIQYGSRLDAFADVHTIARFLEKPDAALAQKLLAQGGYGWNSGMFLMSPQSCLNELAAHAPAIARASAGAYAGRVDVEGMVLPDAQAFEQSPAIAFDYAVMEQTQQGAVLPVEMGWHDLGGWAAIAAATPADAQGNSVAGKASLKDVANTFVHANTLHVAAIGLTGMVIVEHDGHVMIAPKDRAGEVREFAKFSAGRAVTHRPWGHFANIDSGSEYKVKKLTITPGQKISLQAHQVRSEHWVVVKGVATVTRGEEMFMLWANQSTYIAAGQTHRLENRGNEDLVIIEVQTGRYLGEDDIERFDDEYSRAEA